MYAVFKGKSLDTLTETVVARLLVARDPGPKVARDLAGGLAVSDPDMPALALALPFSLAAASIDEMLGAGSEAHEAAVDAWRTAALIGAEVLALGTEARIADLVRLWAAGDAVFGG